MDISLASLFRVGAWAPPLVMGAVVAMTPGGGHAQTPNACGDLSNAFGPFDYRKDRGEPLSLVEGAHFRQQVESLIRGQTSSMVGQDIDYTLRAFPNHHRALLAAMRLAEREKKPQPSGMSYPIDCYFDRALRFQSNDMTVRMIYAQFLAKQQKLEEARKQLKYVASQTEDNPFTQYNVGLVYLEIQDYDAARAQAHRAAALGFPRTELRDKLQAAGKWTEPAATTPADAASGAASSPAAAASSAPRPE